MKWQTVAAILGGSAIGVFALIAGLLNLSGMTYVHSGNIVCTDCISQISVNSTYWEVCAEHAGQDEGVLFKKMSRSRRLWVNMDKVESVVLTEPYIQTEIMVPTIKRLATIKHEDYGYLRPLKDGDCFIPRFSQKYNPNGGRFYIHGIKPETVTVKWSFILDSSLSQTIDIDPLWLASVSNDADLVAHWPLDGTATDNSGNGHDGTVTSAFVDRGIKGRAFGYDGDGDDKIRINTVYAGTPTLNKTFTYSAWFNAADLPAQLFVVGFYNARGAIKIQAGKLTGVYINASVDTNSIATTDNVSTDTWHHAAYTKSDVDGTALYLDGALVANDSSQTEEVKMALDIMGIGNQIQADIGVFNGSIDEVRVYNRSLSAAEIAELYDSGQTYKVQFINSSYKMQFINSSYKLKMYSTPG